MSSSTQPIPISTSKDNRERSLPRPESFDHSPRTVPPTADLAEKVPADGGVECPPAFLPRVRQDSQIRLDVFHHPAELHTPTNELTDPFSTSQDDMIATSPQLDSDPSTNYALFDTARSPVLAIYHSRTMSPEDEEAEVSQTFSGLSLNNDSNPARRMSSVASETTYVPITPLPSYCTLSFLDRPREMAILIQKNPDLFMLIEHAVPPEKYKELEALWKVSREQISDEDWVAKTRSYIAMGPDEDEGGCLWARWKELVGYDPDGYSDGEADEYEWNFQPSDLSLHRRWSELDKARGEEGSGIAGMGAIGTGLSDIKEGEEEELDESDRSLREHAK